MAAAARYDAIVIGTGQGGKPLARALGDAGHSVAIVERDHVGGTCVNVGCTPTKTMVASARVAHVVGRAADYGVEVAGPRVDLSEVRERKRSIVESFRGGSRRRLEEHDELDLIFGGARFTGPETVTVTDEDGSSRQIHGERIFINTGCRPAVPSIEGLDSVDYLDSSSIMELGDVPEHLLVVGGGYIGLEFGQMFRRFGSEVTIMQRGGQLLTREDPDVADEVAGILEEDGVTVELEANASRVEPAGAGISMVCECPDGDRRLNGSHLLVAAGRTPNTDDLGLEAAGVETDEGGWVKVNERLETSVPGIWALGDVKGGPQFTHIAYDDYRLLETNLVEGGNATTEDRPVPYTVFIDPELGRVGMTETEAREAGIEYRVARLPMSRVARALERDETRGFMKALVHAHTDRILGCAILGVEGGEVMSVLQVAMMGDLPYTALRDGVFAHPTLAESLNNLFMTLE